MSGTEVAGPALDDEYDNRGHIPGGDLFPALWAERAAALRARLAAAGRWREGLAYGPYRRERFDLALPEGAPAGLMVFVHGGYWRAFDRGDWSHLAAGAVARGWAVALVGYPLCPKVRVSRITAAVAAAIARAAEEVPGPIALAGHSAGGHLVARMLMADVPLPEPVRARIGAVMPVSPVADLRPLRRTAINADLRLDAAEAVRESPALGQPVRAVPLPVVVGAAERPAFLAQARWLAEAWPGGRLIAPLGRHHFDVIELFERPDDPLLAGLLREAAGAG
ncbi:MAG: alpha/beta hydrolase [Alphaproteobacteria bacterium]|nr:MAG: alpha/beta hydrolase [Alphaproteobacteria bacterium]